jgi:hypothetical protein
VRELRGVSHVCNAAVPCAPAASFVLRGSPSRAALFAAGAIGATMALAGCGGRDQSSGTPAVDGSADARLMDARSSSEAGDRDVAAFPPEAGDVDAADLPEAGDIDAADLPEAGDIDATDLPEAGDLDATLDGPIDAPVDSGPPPALSPDAATVTCPTTIVDALHSTDPTQTGRLSRVTPISACGMTKSFPGSAADPSNPHFYHAYRFVNTSGASSCFTFTLTYPATASADASTADASLDDASLADASMDDAGDASMQDASPPPPPPPVAQKFMTAYTTFYPSQISNGYLGDVGNQLVPPQTMAITVPAGGAIDVVVFALDVAPAGVDTFTLSCAAQ